MVGRFFQREGVTRAASNVKTGCNISVGILFARLSLPGTIERESSGPDLTDCLLLACLTI